MTPTTLPDVRDRLARLLTTALDDRRRFEYDDFTDTVAEWNAGYISGLTTAVGTMFGIDPYDTEQIFAAIGCAPPAAIVGNPIC